MSREVEKLLEILMDDKKYSSRVKELKALEASLSEVRKIAATVQEANIRNQSSLEREKLVLQYQKDMEDKYAQRAKDVEDELKKRKLELDERASKEREQYKDSRDIRAQGLAALTHVQKVQDEVEKKLAELLKFEQSIKHQAQELAQRVHRVNEAYHG